MVGLLAVGFVANLLVNPVDEQVARAAEGHRHDRLDPGTERRPMSSATHDRTTAAPTHTPMGLIAFAWTLVGVPLAYGLYQTVKTALSLFTG